MTCTFIYVHMVTMSACAALSKRWRPIDYSISTKNLYELAFISTKLFFIEKRIFMLYLSQHTSVWCQSHMHTAVLLTWWDTNLVWLDVLILASIFIYTHISIYVWRHCLHAQLHLNISVLLIIQ